MAEPQQTTRLERERGSCFIGDGQATKPTSPQSPALATAAPPNPHPHQLQTHHHQEKKNGE